jgi:hypothetical protein
MDYYASSTMDLVDEDEQHYWSESSSSSYPTRLNSNAIYSTMQQYGSEHDFDPSLTATTRSPVQYDFETWNELTQLVQSSSKYYGRTVAVEMDLVQARNSRHQFDKIVLLIHHGEEEPVQAESSCESKSARQSIIPQDSKLSDRGVGQALSLARRISAFCNSETGFLPELFVLAPLRQVMQTTMLALPHYSPFYSYQMIPWLCHTAAATTTTLPTTVTSRRVTQGASGDFASNMPHQLPVHASSPPNKEEWIQRTDAILDMLRDRDEQVVVVCTESNWLQTFGCTTQYQRSQQLFRHGELRAIGINFI